jgi:phosphoglycerate kinase
MSYRTLDDLTLSGQRVLIRVDLNVPVNDAGEVTDKTRVQRVLPTLESVLEKGGKPILLAHFGRPKGQRVDAMSLRVVVDALAEVTGRKVHFADDCIGPAAREAVSALPAGEILLLENTRFHPGEEKNDPALAEALAENGDVFVNDAFSAAHRAHASTVGIASHLPAVAGRSMASELAALEKALTAPERPVVAVVGGAKVSTKLDLIGNLVGKVDAVVIGGGMANTFLAAQGHPVGKSLCEHDMLDTAREVMKRAGDAGCDIILPVDLVVAEGFAAHSPNRVVAVDGCPDDMMIFDAGPASTLAIVARFKAARTVVWNGPLGAFEIAPFDTATNAAARAAADLTQSGALLSVAGGGDTVAALNASGSADRFSYVSTAGGAFLEWLEGKTLPGVAGLEP